ncbi:MAG: sulfatase [Planctomycetes bacterium]|nr:sulfatase [Planctomycetota bacterium]
MKSRFPSLTPRSPFVRILSWFVLAAALVPVSCSLFGGGVRPNLLVITVDSLRFDALSRSLGAPATPHLQALEAEGQHFTHCYSHSPVALPAHVALFSARLPHQSGVIGNGMPIDPEVTLLAEWMKSRGYSTAAAVSLASLWPPRAEDLSSPNANRHGPTGLERGFGSYATGDHEIAPASEVNARLLAQLDALPADQPWFLFAQYSEPRAPYEARTGTETRARVRLDGKDIDQVVVSESGQWRRELELGPGVHELVLLCDAPIEVLRFDCHGPKERIPERFAKGRAHEAAKRIVIALENTTSEPVACTIDAWIHDVPDVAQARSRYRGEVEAVDAAVGELVKGLRERGVYDNTLIVFTADHGEALGEHGYIGHGQGLYDEVLRVPLIVKPQRGCGGFQALSKLEHAPFRQMDIVPTALDLMGLRSLPGAEGVSLLAQSDRTHFAEIHPPEAPNSILCRRDERYKLVFTSGIERWELYDVTADTLEVDNVFEMQGHFRATWQSELRQLALNSPQAANARMGMTSKRPEHLKALGY